MSGVLHSFCFIRKKLRVKEAQISLINNKNRALKDLKQN